MHASALLFGAHDLREADAGVFEVLAGELPVTEVPRESLGEGVPLVDALLGAGLANSKGDARRVLQGNGYAVNGARESSADRRLTTDDLLAGGWVLLQKGKKNYALVRAG
jgi:tyrosyl-tRNA synthetase